jgi:CHAT domain-containing protein
LPPDLLARLAELRRLLNEAYAKELNDLDETEKLAELEKIRQYEEEIIRLERRLELVDPNYGGLSHNTPLTTAQVQAQLPPDAVVLTFVADVDDHLWLLVLNAESVEAYHVPRLQLHWLQEMVRDFLDGERRGSLVPDPKTHNLIQLRLFSDLYRVLLAPVMPLLERAQTVYIIPFGPLYYLPVGSFAPTPDGSSPLLAAGRRVVYAPSATVLLTYCHQRPPSPHDGILVVAPASHFVQATYGAARSLGQIVGSRALIGEEANRKEFFAAAPQHRVICFFGHAAFDHKHPMLSYFQLADERLDAVEIVRNLRYHADLFVLAACETGRAAVLRGDEILGLTRAIFYAGTPSLMVTLWQVYDIPTRLLLDAIYGELTQQDRLKPSLDAALALATAQNWLRTLTFAEALQHMGVWDDLTPALAEVQLTELADYPSRASATA